METFIEVTEIDQRGIRRLAQSRGVNVSRTGVAEYVYSGVTMSDDEVWGVVSALPQIQTLGGKGRSL